jgi:hypothetical protein
MEETNMHIKRMIRLCASLGLVTALVISAMGADARIGSKREVPKFEVDPSWPKIPNGWTLGQVSSVASDEQDNIWILHRPRTVKPGVKTGPTVMEFDQAGNYIQGWGGPGEGYDWPQAEHGIFIDHKGYVWITGEGPEDQVLKFTKAGKFVMQIGHGGHKKTNQDTENFWKPQDVAVYAKTNEVFVADGNGNKRIIVFDAETGKYKRMWGGFGNVPMDAATSTEGGEGGGKEADPNRRLATELSGEFDPKDPGPPQFGSIHAVKVSNDGLVYVADKAAKRVQVFTVDGKFVSQAWVDRWCLVIGQGCDNAHTAAGLAFSADPGQRFLYVASRSPARVLVFDRKTRQLLDSFGRPGIAPGEFDVLHHMTSDSKGNLYVSEVEDGRRVQKFVFKGISTVSVK